MTRQRRTCLRSGGCRTGGARAQKRAHAARVGGKGASAGAKWMAGRPPNGRL